MENLYSEHSIRTVSGNWVNIFAPTPDMFDIEDIAHALSHQCRFGGHLPVFYSVASHSVMCATIVDPEHKLAALLHDASEAYLCDIPSPIKKHLTNYRELEDGLMKVIAEKFGFEYPLHDQIKGADATLLVREWNEIMLGKSPLGISAIDAKTAFMASYQSIKHRYSNNIISGSQTR